MFEKIISVLPKIGGVVGRLLTSVFNGEEEVYIQYDLPTTGVNGTENGTTPAIFTNEKGKILLTNHSLNKKKHVKIHFPSSPLAAVDDVTVPGAQQSDVTNLFSAHAKYNDGQFELAAYDTDALMNSNGTYSMLNHVICSEIPTDGTPSKFGALFEITAKNNTLVIRHLYGGLIDGISRIRIMLDNDGEVVEQTALTAKSPENTFIVDLTFNLDPTLVPKVAIEANISIMQKSSELSNYLEKTALNCTPISENTLKIISKGNRLN